jgi:hypothetical protein
MISPDSVLYRQLASGETLDRFIRDLTGNPTDSKVTAKLAIGWLSY